MKHVTELERNSIKSIRKEKTRQHVENVITQYPEEVENGRLKIFQYFPRARSKRLKKGEMKQQKPFCMLVLQIHFPNRVPAILCRNTPGLQISNYKSNPRAHH